MLRIGGDFFDVGFSYVAGIVFSDVLYAVINVVGGTLGEHLDGAVRHVANETGELMAFGHPVSGEAKTDALDSTRENDTSGNHFLMDYSSFLSTNRSNNNDDILIEIICSHKRTILPSCSNK